MDNVSGSMSSLGDAYGFASPQPDVVETMEDLYRRVDDGTCSVGLTLASSPQIPELNLRVLEDDKGFFGAFNASLAVRTEAVEEHPELEDIFAPIAEALDDETIRELNRRVAIDGEDAGVVAKNWLREQGFIDT